MHIAGSLKKRDPGEKPALFALNSALTASFTYWLNMRYSGILKKSADRMPDRLIVLQECSTFMFTFYVNCKITTFDSRRHVVRFDSFKIRMCTKRNGRIANELKNHSFIAYKVCPRSFIGPSPPIPPVPFETRGWLSVTGDIFLKAI